MFVFSSIINFLRRVVELLLGFTTKIIKFLFLPASFLLYPFTALLRYKKDLFTRILGTDAAPQLMMGGPPVDHSEPDMSDKVGRTGGQILYILIAVFFVLAVIWAMTAEIDEQVRAEGIIITPSDVQHVQSRLPGSLVEINVKLGSVVNKGDVLFRLEDEDVLANFEDNEIVYHSARATEVRLAAELGGDKTLSFPKDLRVNHPELVAQESALFNSRHTAFKSRLMVLESAVETLSRSIAEKRAEARISIQQANLFAEELALLTPLVQNGHVPRAMLLSSKTRHQQARGSAELALLSAAARESDLRSKKQEIQATIDSFKADAAAKLVEVQTLSSQYLTRQDALQGKVGHAEIKAPLSGIVLAVHVKTVGAVVQAGTVLVDIVPSESALLARAQVLPQNVTSVRPGQIARLSISAYDPSRFGVMMGVVQRVSNNTTQPDNQPPFYETIIEIPKIQLTKSNLIPQITAGMPLTVDILGDKRTVMNYIMTPI